MTEQNKAPERIWIDACGGNWSPKSGGTQGIEYIRADLIPSAALAVPEVKALVVAVECERNHKSAYDATTAALGGDKGKKTKAHHSWLDARADVGAALAALKGGAG